MGSAPSRSTVKVIQVPSEEINRCRQSSSHFHFVSEQAVVNGGSSMGYETTELQKITEELQLLKKMMKKERLNLIMAEEKTQTLQEKLDNKEEEILSLRSELTSMNEQVLQQQASMAESSVQLRDQYIEKLEDELNHQKNEASRLSGRYDRKLRKVREMLSKSRQDSALKLFEMKNENTKLTKDNLKLQERLDRVSLNSSDGGRYGSAGSRKSCLSYDTTESQAESSDNRTALILELSQQVSQLDAENMRLKQELKNARRIVEKVERAKTLKRSPTQQKIDNVSLSGNGNEFEQETRSSSPCIEAVR